MAVLPSLIGAGTGLFQALFSGKRRRERELERFAQNMPQYQGSQALDKFYQQSLQNATLAAQQSALYKQQTNMANRAMAAGLTAPGIGQGNVAKLVQGTQDAYGRALSQAEGLREQRMGVLGQASQMKAADDMRKYQFNQMKPFEARYNLLAARAAAAGRQQQAGFGNLASGLVNAGTILAAGQGEGDNNLLGFKRKKRNPNAVSAGYDDSLPQEG